MLCVFYCFVKLNSMHCQQWLFNIPANCKYLFRLLTWIPTHYLEYRRSAGCQLGLHFKYFFYIIITLYISGLNLAPTFVVVLSVSNQLPVKLRHNVKSDKLITFCQYLIKLLNFIVRFLPSDHTKPAMFTDSLSIYSALPASIIACLSVL